MNVSFLLCWLSQISLKLRRNIKHPWTLYVIPQQSPVHWFNPVRTGTISINATSLSSKAPFPICLWLPTYDKKCISQIPMISQTYYSQFTNVLIKTIAPYILSFFLSSFSTGEPGAPGRVTTSGLYQSRSRESLMIHDGLHSATMQPFLTEWFWLLNLLLCFCFRWCINSCSPRTSRPTRRCWTPRPTWCPR